MRKIIFLIYLINLWAIPSFALSAREEIAVNLRKPKESEKVSISKPLVYIIDREDILGISVWQNLTFREEGDKFKQKEYTINKSDLLDISVWQWPDLAKEVIVRPDGRISFPLVGDIKVEGLTLTELDNLLTEKLTEFIKSPEVSVMIKQFAAGVGVAKGALPFIKITDLSFDTLKVRLDGKISLPPIGEFQAEGLTLDELSDSINAKVSKLVNNSDVFVQVNEFGGNKVIVLGEVPDPGIYITGGNLTILEALSLAGGYTKDAILREVLVLRGDLSNPKIIKVNVNKAITGRDFSQNIPIEPRDTIYVPKSLISDVNYVLTQILGPLTSSSSAVTAIKTMRKGTSVKK